MAEFIDWILRSECVKAIFELNIPEILSSHGKFLSAKDICGYVRNKSQKEINSNYLQRIMRYLTCAGVFVEKYDGHVIRFNSSNELKHIDKNSLLRLDTYSEIGVHLMSALDGSTKDEALVKHVTGMDAWDRDEDDLERQDNFKGALDDFINDLAPYIPTIAKEIKKESKDVAKIVDLGGGSGKILQMLKNELPKLECVNFDMPHIIKALKDTPNMELVPGDFFDVTTMPKCDVVFTRNILHDWGDEQCIKLMTNVYEVLSDDGLFLSVNYDLPEPGDETELTSFVIAMDLDMLMLLNSKERTLREYKEIHNKAGFEVKRNVALGPVSRPCSLLIATKLKQ